MEAILDFDERLFIWFNAFAGRSVALDSAIFFMAEYVIFIIALCTIIFILKKTKEEELMAVTAFLGVIIGRVIVTPLVRFFFFRPRPFLDGGVLQLIPKDPAEASFPSGHAVIMFALAFAVFHKHKGWGSLMFAFAFISALSRVVAGVHYPADILAGIVIGFLAYLIAKWIINYLQKSQSLRNIFLGKDLSNK